MLVTFAYTMVKYYDSAIPGVGSSLKGFINGGAQNLVGLIGTDRTDSIMNTLSQAQQNDGPVWWRALHSLTLYSSTRLRT